MAQKTLLAGLAGAIAAATISATPVHAAELTSGAGIATSVHADFARGGPFDSTRYDTAAETGEYHRRWRGYRRYRRNRVDAGDVIAGVLVLGGIAAIASAASNNNRRRDRYEDRRYQRRYDDRRYDDRRRSNPRTSGGSGLDNAVSQCLAEIERDVRVDGVDNASRGPSGWVVSGTLFNGSPFTCRIDNDGRISDVDYGNGGFSASNIPADGQWSDQRYADARAAAPRAEPTNPADLAAVDGDLAVTSEARPAYPGGPLPGESFSE